MKGAQAMACNNHNTDRAIRGEVVSLFPGAFPAMVCGPERVRLRAAQMRLSGRA